jgi:hypothetical protein
MWIKQSLTKEDWGTLNQTLLTPMSSSPTNKTTTSHKQQISISIGQTGESIESIAVEGKS